MRLGLEAEAILVAICYLLSDTYSANKIIFIL